MSSQPSWTVTDAGGTPTPGDEAPWIEEDEEATSPVTEEASIAKETEKEVSTEAAATPVKKRWGSIALLVVSTIFFAIFLYSAIVQQNDGDGLQWIFFYAIHATIPGMFLFHYFCCFPDKLIYGLSAAMACWSVAFLIISSIDLSKTETGGAKVGTGDEDNLTFHTELAFEVAGSALTLASAFYHIIMMKCCVGKKKDDEGGAAVMS